jgi:hypothetical protein
MLRNAKNLHGFTIRATDGELGTVDQLYFDDETWAIRYLTVETGGWLGGRQVLISPISIIRADWQTKGVDVLLTKNQVENSPDVDTHQPVSRRHEADFNLYYGYPSYWGGPYLWGAAPYPADLVTPPVLLVPSPPDDLPSDPADSHLRSTQEVTGYSIEAADGEIGHVDGFVFDDGEWAIRYIEVATRNWWPGKKVLVSPAWIERVSWGDFKVYTALTREAIQNAPEYAESAPITREYENRLYFHYGRPPYWLHDAERRSPVSLTSV